MKKFLSKLSAVSVKDFLHIFKLAAAIIPAYFLKKKRKNMWLICEYENEARDNGYRFFEYICKNHRQQDAVYAINKKCDDFEKVSRLGQTVDYGSLKHWIYYLAASVNISSQKGGKPNAAVCYFLEVYGILKNKRVFLQHGITKDLADLFFYENTKMRLFICGAKPEYDFVREKFGYPEGYVAYTGFARFDALLEPCEKKRQILISPTWRSFLRKASSDPYKQNSNKHITDSQYYGAWKSFLQNERLRELCRKYDYEVIFFPHRNTAHCFDDIDTFSDRIITVNWEDCDLQVLMRQSALMVTDYTSSAMDFAYMEKPVIYYQFDYERYRSEHFAQGYFSYEKDGFGPVVRSEDELVDLLEKYMSGKDGFGEYLSRTNDFFVLRDNRNCERIYNAVKEIDP